MGTHPIFESDFDCLTERSEMVLILKTELGGDLRRIPLPDDISFDKLHSMLRRVYSVDIGDDDKVKFKDLDGDWITIADSKDLQLAIQIIQKANQETLRLKIDLTGSCSKCLRKCKYYSLLL